MSRTQVRESDDGQSPPKQKPGTSRQMSALSTLSMASKTVCHRATLWRYRMALMLHLASAIVILLRMNISLALVCMTRHALSNGSTDGSQASDDLANSSSPDFAGGNTSATAVSAEFDWDSSIQGLIFSSGGFISFLFPIFADPLCRLMGSKLVMTSFTLLAGVLTILNPLAAGMSPYFLIVLRVFIGAAGGLVLPVSTGFFSWWSPESEKVTIASLTYAGINVGNILVGAPSGYMCSIPIANGWPFIFYVHGAFTILWCVVWHFCASEKPEDHPFISEEEKTYIIRTRLAMDVSQKTTAPPYLAIVTSKPVWAFLLVMISHSFATMIIFSYMPKYIATVFEFNSEQVGLITSVSYVSRILGIVVFNFLSNSLFSRTHLTKTTIRKVVQCSGFFLCGGCLMILGFLTNDVAALLLLNIIMMGQSCSMVAGFILPLDLAPRYAGFLSAVFMSVGGIIGIPGPIIVGLMTPEGTLEEWRNVFIFIGASFVFGAVTFLFLGKSDLQPWAVPPGSTAAEEERRPVTSELINRRMTIMSSGPPLSPKINQTRFRFDAGVDYNFQSASFTRDISLWPSRTDGPQARAVSNDVTGITVTELEELRFDEVSTTAPYQIDNHSNSFHVTRTDVNDKDVNSNDYVNPGFLSDAEVVTAGEDQVENKAKEQEKMV